MKRRKTPGETGFTLLEILIGMAIALIVMGALIEVFSSQNKIYYQQTQLAKAQAAARTALYQLARDVRMAGYTGIPLGSKFLSTETMSGRGTYFPVMSIYSGNTVQSGTPDSVVAVAGGSRVAYASAIIDDLEAMRVRSDAIEIRGNFFRQTTTLSNPVAPGVSSLPVLDPAPFRGVGFNRPGWVVIGQRGKAVTVEFYPFAGLDGSEVQINGSLRNEYLYPAETIVAPLYSRVYFATGADPNLPREQQRRLWVANYIPDASGNSVLQSEGSPVELAVDIDNFQISYHLLERERQQGGDVVTLRQHMVCDPCEIRAVTLSLWTIADKYREENPLRRQFSTTVQTRNLGFESINCPLSLACAGY